MKTLAFYNNKGGVGKTTTVINIAYTLAQNNKKVLVIDCDGQQNLSRFFANKEITLGIEEALISEISPDVAFSATRYKNIDVVVSTAKINNAIGIFEELSETVKIRRLAKIKNWWANDYDFILLDLPPALNIITTSFLSIADEVIVPIELGTFAIQGIANVTETINKVGVKFCGCFVSKFDKSNPADFQLMELLKNNLGNKSFENNIPYSRVVKNSISYKLTAAEYMEWTEAVADYVQLTQEILMKVGE
ncbi:MAG: ParA family protein [Oscillospiraceae bacterium]